MRREVGLYRRAVRGLRARRPLPACGGVFVAGARLDPALAFGRLFFFPEWRAGLEVIHDELARGERLSAVCAGDRDEHDLVAWLERPDAVNDERVVDIPAPLCIIDNLLQRFLGHPRVMLQG